MLNYELWAYRQLSEDERKVIDMYAIVMRKLKSIVDEKIINEKANPWFVPVMVLDSLTTDEQLVILRHDQILTKMRSIAEGKMYADLDVLMYDYEKRNKKETEL